MREKIRFTFTERMYTILAHNSPWPVDAEAYAVNPILKAALTANLKGETHTYWLNPEGLFYRLCYKVKQYGNSFYTTAADFMVPIPYSGSIVMVIDPLEGLDGTAYQYPHAYKEVWECTFLNGKIATLQNCSDMMQLFRDMLHTHGLRKKVLCNLNRSDSNRYDYENKWDIYRNFKIK